MKKKNLLFILILFFSIFSITAQPGIEWQKCYGGSNVDFATSIQETSDSGYIVTGYSLSNDGDLTINNGNYDYWVVKTNNIGIIQWQKSLGGTGAEYAHSIQQTTDGGYIVAGKSNSNDGDVTGNHGAYDCWVVKLTNTGVISWQKSYGGTNDDGAESIQQTTDGGYIIAGYSESSDGDLTANQGGSDCWVIKIDSSGGITWQKSIGGSDFEDLHSVQQTFDGGYIVTGDSESNDGDLTANQGIADTWVVKLSTTGVIEWQNSLGGTDFELAYSIQQTADSGYVAAGYTQSNNGDVTGNHGSKDGWVVKLTPNGTLSWQKSLGGTGVEELHSVQQTTDGGFVVFGNSNSNDGDVTGNQGMDDYWVVKLTPTGTISWQKSLGGSDREKGFSIQLTSDGGFILAGNSGSTDGDITDYQGAIDYWVVKLSFTVETIEQQDLSDITIYPNPTNGNFTINLGEQKQAIKATLINGLGQVLFVKEFKSTNLFNLQIDTPKGIYFLKLESKGKLITKKIVIE